MFCSKTSERLKCITPVPVINVLQILHSTISRDSLCKMISDREINLPVDLTLRMSFGKSGRMLVIVLVNQRKLFEIHGSARQNLRLSSERINRNDDKQNMKNNYAKGGKHCIIGHNTRMTLVQSYKNIGQVQQKYWTKMMSCM